MEVISPVLVNLECLCGGTGCYSNKVQNSPVLVSNVLD